MGAASMRDAKAAIKQQEHARSHAALKLDEKCDGGRSCKLLCVGWPACRVSYGIYKHPDGTYRVGKVNAEHSGCTAVNKVSTSVLAGLEVVQRAVLANPDISGKALLQQAKNHASVIASLQQAYKARKMIVGDQQALVDESFGRLAPYLQELKRLNPGAHVDIEVASDGTFQRLFVALGQCVKASLTLFCSDFSLLPVGMAAHIIALV